MYLHSWEFDPEMPRVKVPGFGYSFRHYNNLARTLVPDAGSSSRMLDAMNARFLTMGEFVDSVRVHRPDLLEKPARATCSDRPSMNAEGETTRCLRLGTGCPGDPLDPDQTPSSGRRPCTRPSTRTSRTLPSGSRRSRKPTATRPLYLQAEAADGTARRACRPSFSAAESSARSSRRCRSSTVAGRAAPTDDLGQIVVRSLIERSHAARSGLGRAPVHGGAGPARSRR